MAGRHSSALRRRSRVRAVLATAVVTLAVALGGTSLVGAIGSGDPACTGSQTLTLAAAPEVAPVVADASDAPDLWVPDFSVWVGRAARAGADPVTLSASLATTPVVLAGGNGGPPASWQEVGRSGAVYLDPLTSSASTAALLAAFGEIGRTGASREEVASMIVPLAQQYGARTDRPENVEEVVQAVVRGERAVLTEQQLVSRSTGGAGIDAVVPETGASVLDHPLVALTADASTREAGRRLAGHLAGPEGVDILTRHGFRDTAGTPLPRGRGVGEVEVIPLPDASSVGEILRRWAVLTVPSRSLAVVDVSGSMDEVDGREARIDLVVGAAQRALQLFPDNAEIGMWAFSVGLGGGNQDHRAIVPVRRLGEQVDGRSQREALGAAFARLSRITDGGTGLYDTTLAAVRTVQDSYDARAVNSVILLTDGRNDDPGSLTLRQLLRTMEREGDPARPVPVIAIGMGPDADARALRRIAGATGGSSYVARKPADISKLFVDAMLNR